MRRKAFCTHYVSCSGHSTVRFATDRRPVTAFSFHITSQCQMISIVAVFIQSPPLHQVTRRLCHNLLNINISSLHNRAYTGRSFSWVTICFLPLSETSTTDTEPQYPSLQQCRPPAVDFTDYSGAGGGGVAEVGRPRPAPAPPPAPGARPDMGFTAPAMVWHCLPTLSFIAAAGLRAVGSNANEAAMSAFHRLVRLRVWAYGPFVSGCGLTARSSQDVGLRPVRLRVWAYGRRLPQPYDAVRLLVIVAHSSWPSVFIEATSLGSIIC